MPTDAIGQYQPVVTELSGRPDSPTKAAAGQHSAALAHAAQESAPATLSQKTLDTIAKDLQQSLSKANTGLQFSVDNSTGKTVIRVVHEQSGELIRQIPSEEMLAIARNIGKMQGLLFEKKA